MRSTKVVMIGAGHLGSLILKAWVQKKLVKTSDLSVHVNSQVTQKKIKRLFPKVKVSANQSTSEIPTGDVYVVAVKPQQWESLKIALQKKVNKNTLVLSIMAGIPPSRLEKELGCAVVVAMTNTSIQVNNALTSLYKSPSCNKKQLLWAKKAFSPFGLLVELEEKDFAVATALGGSHPAFAIWILNEISKIVSDKLPGQDGVEWTLNIFSGAEKLIRKKKSISEILSQIATPGGCTAEGLKALEELEIKEKLLQVFDRCAIKAQGLGK